MFAVDESTTIKNHKAKRTRIVTNLAKGCEYRRILTGSPVTQSPMDLYAQCAFLDPDLLGCDNYYQFQARYANMRRINMGAHSFNKIVSFKNLEELAELLRKFSSRVLKKDCLDLPSKTYTIREVSLHPEQLQHYMTMKKAALVILEDDTIFAQEAMTQLLRLQQILCGYLPVDDQERLSISRPVAGCPDGNNEETSGKIIIWARFRKDIQRIEEALVKKYGRELSVHMGYAEADRDDLLNFSDPDHATGFVGNPQTAGRSDIGFSQHSHLLLKRFHSKSRTNQRIGAKHRSGTTRDVYRLAYRRNCGRTYRSYLRGKIVLAGVH